MDESRDTPPRSAVGDLRLGVAWYPPVLAGAWSLGWLVARFISAPLGRVVLRAGAAHAMATEASL